MADPTEWTPDHVVAHAQRAVALELFTIPAYLCAYWSIIQGRSPAVADAAERLRGVVNQEMLHLELVCNLSSALGRPPALTGAAPSYPGRVPYNQHDIEVVLGPASPAQLRAFMTLELPTWLEPYQLSDLPPQDRYETIGDFYHALIHGIQAVYGADGAGAPWPGGVNGQAYGNFRDDDFRITDAASAVKAIQLVVLQGEGASKTNPHDDDPGELAHYYQLQKILGALGPGDVRPMVPATAGLGYGSRCARLLDFFDACYADLLSRLEATFHGRAAIGPAVGLMWASLNALAVYVVEVPYRPADDAPETGSALTPRFRFTTTTPSDAYAALDPADHDAAAVAGVAAAMGIGR